MTRPAASRSLIRAHTLMDSEPLMTPVREVLGVARRGLGSDFSGLFRAPTAGDMDRQLDQMPSRGNKRK
jgi:hypothetical protein